MRGGIFVPDSLTAQLGFPGDGLSNLNDGAVATFITPTDSDTSNDLSGVWFTSGDLNPSLFGLPLPPAGWVYEGWAIHSGVPLSTGRFTDYTMPDDGNPFIADELPAPSAPGEDFLQSDSLVYGFSLPIEFGDGDDVAVTVEPDAEWDAPGPFPYKIYVGDPGQTPMKGQTYQLNALDASFEDNAFPKAVATITKPPDE